jgi:hypothetical protein
MIQALPWQHHGNRDVVFHLKLVGRMEVWPELVDTP